MLGSASICESPDSSCVSWHGVDLSYCDISATSFWEPAHVLVFERRVRASWYYWLERCVAVDQQVHAPMEARLLQSVRQ
jgi:hypothetical protein